MIVLIFVETFLIVLFLFLVCHRLLAVSPPVVDVTPIPPPRRQVVRQYRSRKNKRRTTGGWSGAVAL